MLYFVCSDIHSFYDLWQEALKDAGYDKYNENHTLIVCGDIFDRGDKPIEVYKFLRSIPKERRILIRGNHEYLLRDLYDRKYVMDHDRHNKTNDTLAIFNNVKKYEEFLDDLYYIMEDESSRFESLDLPFEERIKAISGIQDKRANLNKEYENSIFKDNKLAEEVIDWIFSDEWVNFYELDRFVFVHAFIPLIIDEKKLEETYNRRGFEQAQTYNKDWRTVTSEKEWDNATWGCPYTLFLKHFKDNEPDKTLVVGHWHTSDFFKQLKGFTEERFDIYYSKHLIGLDGCTAYSNECNVMKIDENFKCYQHNKLLKEVKSKYKKQKTETKTS